MEGMREAKTSVVRAVAAEAVARFDDDMASSADVVVAQADSFVAWLATTSGAGVTDAVRIDRITALERVKGAVAAAQARQTAAFAESQRAAIPSWTPERAIARSIGSQIALARHEAPPRGDAHVGLAEALVAAMPRTLAALTAGEISEGAAEAVHRAVEDLDPTMRREVDRRLAPELHALGERSLAEAARRVVCDVDDDAATRRVERAIQSRRVTLRTAPDGMAYLTLLAPMTEATGAFHAVEAETTAILGEPGRVGASSRRSMFWLTDPAQASPAPTFAKADHADDWETVPAPTSDSSPARQALPSLESRRTRSQLMADLVIARLTGRAVGRPVPIEIQLVMTDQTLSAAGPTKVAGASRAKIAAASPTASRATGSTKIGAASPAKIAGASPTASTATGSTKITAASPTASTASGSTKTRAVSPARSASASPAKVVGSGWLPPGFAVGLVRRTAAAGSTVTVRRVFVDGDAATVVGMEARRQPLREDLAAAKPAAVLTPTTSTQRLFRGVLRRLVVVRDQTCRTPFCAAAIRAVDHIDPFRHHGPTRIANAEGMCVRCNLTKEAPGWEVAVLGPTPKVRSTPDHPTWEQLLDELVAADPDQSEPDCSHRTAVVTPTGHRYESTAPPVTEPCRTRRETTPPGRIAHGPSG